MTLEEALAKIADQEKTLGDLQAKLTTTEGRLTNAEALIGRQSTEVGTLRKENETLKAAADRVKVLETELNGMKAGGSTTAGGQQDEPTVDELEARLTEDQQKVLDDAYSKATVEQRRRIAEDPKVRMDFLKRAVEIAAPVPDTWRKPQRKADEGRSNADDIAALFDTHRRKTTQPTGARSRGVREATGRDMGGAAERPKLNPQDVSGSLRRAREAQKKE